MLMPPGFAKPTEPLELEPEELSVRRWRERQLLAAGFSEFAAFRIAIRFDVPYQRAVHMLEHGATELQVTDLLID